MLGKIVAVVLGVVAGSVVNMMLVSVSQMAYPLPDAIDPNDLEALKAYVEANGMAAGALLIVLLAHSGGSLVSGVVCGVIAQRAWYLGATILGVIWMCGGMFMLTVLPSPTWFAVADTVLYVPAALLGVRIGGAFTGKIASNASMK